MKKNTIINALIVSLVLIGTNTFAQQDQTSLKSEISFGSGFTSTTLTTFLKVEHTNKQFIITSPKNADVRLFGGFKSKLGRILGKSPKKGIFLTINAKQKGDSLIGSVRTIMLGQLKFKGVYKNDSLSGEIIKNDSLVVGNINGAKSQERSIDYSYLFPKIIDITEKNIYSKEVLKTDEWVEFQKELKKTLHKVQDDIELFIAFRTLSQKLPFSHYYLMFRETAKIEEANSIANTPEKKEPTVIYEKKGENTVYLKIKNFSTSTKELAHILPKIIKEKPKNLIIDLRNNGGGGIEAAFEFGKYIMNDNVEIGYFVTNKLQYTGFDIDLFKKLPVAEAETTKEFVERLKHGKGAKLVFNHPGTSVFSGNIFVLTNGGTGSTCEPIAYMLKESKRATLIGEKTAGAMLSGTPFAISGKYKLFMPIADFYTYDGVRLEGMGVTPNIETPSENALNKALSLINNQK